MTGNRGSEWRIWDLHVHTPISLKNNYNCSDDESGWDRYITALENLPPDIKVLGINDYLFIDGYKKVKEFKKKGRLQNIELILPVVEFRIRKFCGQEQFKRINYHIIFSDEVHEDIIQAQFLNALSSHYTLSPDRNIQWGGIVTRKSLEDLGAKIIQSVPEDKRSDYETPLIEGFNNLNLDMDDILQPLRTATQYFNGKYITCIGKTEWDELRWGDGSIAEKKDIINSADIIFTAAESIDKYDKAKLKLQNENVNSLLLDCSDAHSFAENTNNKDRLGNCHCWIKADPTFEGLKQILYEPESRVKIQETKPEEKPSYQIIDSITLNEDKFWQGKILLNQNLNTIIGGRGTGKSTLLRAVAGKISDQNLQRLDSNDCEFIEKHLRGISLRWGNGNDTTKRSIEFFEQNYMYKIAGDEKEIYKCIERIIKGTGYDQSIISYRAKNDELKRDISQNILNAFQLKSEIDILKETLLEKGDKKGIENEIESLKTEIAKLSTNTGLSESENLEYKQKSQEISELELKHKTTQDDINRLNRIQEISIFDSNYLYNLSDFSSTSKTDIEQKFQALKQTTESEWKQSLEEYKRVLSGRKDDNSKKLEELKKNPTFKKCQEYYQRNNELADIQRKFKLENDKLNTIKEEEGKLKTKCNLLDNIIDTIVKAHKEYKENIDQLVNNFNVKHDDIEINTVIKFKKDEFRGFFTSRLSQRGTARQEYIDAMVDNYEKDIYNQCKNFLTKALNQEIEYKNYNENQPVITEFFTTNWFDYSYELTYDNDSFNEMSPGKRAFVILRLLLEFSEKQCPILIDQPEDNMDNRDIYTHLVKYIRAKKTQRQIILVTHNPNIVVGSDAENVIVANHHSSQTLNDAGRKFQYINGSLENTAIKEKHFDPSKDCILTSQGIREHVCEILEGGIEAFKKRESKYGFDHVASR